MESNNLDKIKEQEYQQDLESMQKKDYRFSWVSSSKFLFYLSLITFVLMTWGGCYRLYTKRFEKPSVPVQSSTQYTPVYK